MRAGGWRLEAGGWRLRQAATGDRRPATSDRRPATGDRRPATSDLRPAALLLLAIACLSGGEDQALRDQLRSSAPPWYDAGSDSWRRVEPRRDPPPEKKPERNDDGAGIALPADLIAWALIGLAAAGIAVLVWRAWRAGGDGALPPPAAAPRGSASADLSALPVPAGTVDIEAALSAARARGDWATAVVLLYARLLLRLGEAGAVVLAPGTTNRAYCRATRAWAGEANGRKPVPAALERLTGAFEAVRFGGEPADGRRFAELERLEQIAATALAKGTA